MQVLGTYMPISLSFHHHIILFYNTPQKNNNLFLLHCMKAKRSINMLAGYNFVVTFLELRHHLEVTTIVNSIQNADRDISQTIYN